MHPFQSGARNSAARRSKSPAAWLLLLPIISTQRGLLTDASRATLAFALNARHYALLQPDTLDQRLAISIELAQLAQDSGDWELALHSLPWRLADLLDLGHVRAADETVAAAAHAVEQLHRPLYQWYIGVYRAFARVDAR